MPAYQALTSRRKTLLQTLLGGAIYYLSSKVHRAYPCDPKYGDERSACVRGCGVPACTEGGTDVEVWVGG